jgi:hypothetical protein
MDKVALGQVLSNLRKKCLQPKGPQILFENSHKVATIGTASQKVNFNSKTEQENSLRECELHEAAAAYEKKTSLPSVPSSFSYLLNCAGCR